MPLPNYGYHNEETKQNQELIFEMPPKIVDSNEGPNGKTNNRKKAQVTTGKLGIELERKMVINNDDPDNIWKSPNIDPDDVKSAKQFSETKELRNDVKKGLDCFISSDKLKEIRSNRNKQPLQSSIPSTIIPTTTTKTTPSYSLPQRKEPKPSEVVIPVQRSFDMKPRADPSFSSTPSRFAVSSHSYSVQQTRQSINIQPSGTYARSQTNTFRLN